MSFPRFRALLSWRSSNLARVARAALPPNGRLSFPSVQCAQAALDIEKVTVSLKK